MYIIGSWEPVQDSSITPLDQTHEIHAETGLLVFSHYQLTGLQTDEVFNNQVDQGLANYGLWTKSAMPSICVN